MKACADRRSLYLFVFLLSTTGGWKHDEDDAAQTEGGRARSDEEFLWDNQSHTLEAKQWSHDITRAFAKIMLSTVKDEESDVDVPEDEGSDSDMEECQPSKPRPIRNSIMAGIQPRATHVNGLINKTKGNDAEKIHYILLCVILFFIISFMLYLLKIYIKLNQTTAFYMLLLSAL